MNSPDKRAILETSRKLCEGIPSEELARRMEKHAGTEAARALNRPYPGESTPSRSIVQPHPSEPVGD
jgi:hypothetical protein